MAEIPGDAFVARDLPNNVGRSTLTRDKVIALEVKVEQMALDMQRLADAVEHLNSLLGQARGAKWALGFLLFAGGAMSTYLPALIRWGIALN